MLKHVFTREGYHVELAHNGNQALEMARRLIPDLILLDIQMPEMNGFDVLRHLREEPTTSGIPTIVVSARAREPSDIAMGLNIGADDYIPKPFAPQELLARARSKMRARQLEETLQQRTQELEMLLRFSEELSQHLDIDELFSVILYLMLDLLQGDIALICQFDEQGFPAAHRFYSRNEVLSSDLADQLLQAYYHTQEPYFWTSDPDSHLGIAHGMILPLHQAEDRLGILLIGSNTSHYEVNHQMLFRGIARQTALALHNAELYEIKANYANQLEEMVEERTKQLQAAQEMLFRSEKLASIGHLAASIAHEINNPLQPIRLNMEYILEDIEGNQPIDAELITMTQQQVDRISPNCT